MAGPFSIFVQAFLHCCSIF